MYLVRRWLSSNFLKLVILELQYAPGGVHGAKGFRLSSPVTSRSHRAFQSVVGIFTNRSAFPLICRPSPSFIPDSSRYSPCSNARFLFVSLFYRRFYLHSKAEIMLKKSITGYNGMVSGYVGKCSTSRLSAARSWVA